jgi:hypothetical protein
MEDEIGTAHSRHESDENAYKILICKPEGNRPFGRLRHRWEKNSKMDYKDIMCECGLDSCGSQWGLVIGSCEYGNKPSGSIKGSRYLD